MGKTSSSALLTPRLFIQHGCYTDSDLLLLALALYALTTRIARIASTRAGGAQSGEGERGLMGKRQYVPSHESVYFVYRTMKKD